MSGVYLLSANDWPGLIIRLTIALLVGAIIGFEREIKDKPAGLRTHMLVSFGSALFILVPILISQTNPSADALSRVIQGVTAGIGFLGAGEILRESQPDNGRVKVRGLTSAAAIWVSAALGIAAGCGLLLLSLIGAVVTLVVLKVFKQFEHRP
ncbi:MAG TPA: MgtC/SapB family protein [Coleofasciculaceae cyanobacterium]